MLINSRPVEPHLPSDFPDAYLGVRLDEAHKFFLPIGQLDWPTDWPPDWPTHLTTDLTTHLTTDCTTDCTTY